MLLFDIPKVIKLYIPTVYTVKNDKQLVYNNHVPQRNLIHTEHLLLEHGTNLITHTHTHKSK